MYESANVPGVPWIAPFAALLLCIAILPLIAKTERWWHHNRNQTGNLARAGSAVTLTYYYLRGYGFGGGANALRPVGGRCAPVLHHGVLEEYLPFISLLFAALCHFRRDRHSR